MCIRYQSTVEILSQFFCNYQSGRLDIHSPDLTNLLIILLFGALVLVSLRRGDSCLSDLLTAGQTEQLKGLAIFFVVLGHLWGHVSKAGPRLVLSGEAVSMFLLLSGFGLTMSIQHRKLDLKRFWSKRIKRVMVPYWIATFIILVLDYTILGKHLPLQQLMMTLLGINAGIELRHLDYVRWFLTFILLWYAIFYIAIKMTTGKLGAVCVMLSCAFFLLPLNYYVLDVGWYQFFSFPVGYLLGLYYERLQRLFGEKRVACVLTSLVGMVCVLGYNCIMGDKNTYLAITAKIPTIVLVYIRECNSVALNVATIFLVGHLLAKGYESRVLHLMGKYSYEIFLLHGAFLIKYNPIIRDSGSLAFVLEFAVFLLCVAALSYVLSRTTQALSVGVTS
jgi:membrane-bound acyltransferase YfiQ involved in biofilm formation